MSDEMNNAPEPVAESAEASSAWRDVVAELEALGAAIGRWAKAAVNDPDNQRRLGELSDRLVSLVNDVGAGIKGAADGEVGQSFKEAAEKTGEAFKLAGQKVGDEVGPKLAGAFRTMGEKLRGAADKMEDRGAAAPAADTTPEPPKPAGPSA